jgi:hypothetical protein
VAQKTVYPALAQVTDPATRAVLKLIFDKFGFVEAQLPLIQAQIAALPIPTDAVSQTTMRKYVEGAMWLNDHPVPDPTYGNTPGPGDTPGEDFPPPQEGAGDIRIGPSKTFHLASGAIWPWRGSTDFHLYRQYLDGGAGAVSAIIANRVGSGANLFRVFGAWPYDGFDPGAYANYYTSLAPFAALLAASGAYLEFTCFAGDVNIPFATLEGQAAQTTFLTAVQEAFAGVPNVFIELGNEGKGYNNRSFTKPLGILSSVGEVGDLTTPPWDYGVIHPPRDDDWPRKAKDLLELREGFGTFPGWKRPVVADEPMGAGDVDIGGSRSTVANDFYWFGATAAMMGAGATFHSQNGIDGVVWSATQQACANAFYQAMAAVDPASQLWTYTRGPLTNCPIQHDDAWALRTFAKMTDHEAIVVVIRANASWPGPIVQDGWSVVSSTGPVVSGSGTLIFLSK